LVEHTLVLCFLVNMNSLKKKITRINFS
jgi:hypothetical protein